MKSFRIHCNPTYAFLFVCIIMFQNSSAFLHRQLIHRSLTSRVNLGQQCMATKIWIEPAEDGFVDEDENLMYGEVCLRSMKAFASDPDNTGNKRFLGAAALIQRESSDICDCWMADSLLEETNLQLQGAMMLLDDLFYYHLQRSNANSVEGMISSFLVQSGSADSEYHCASYMAALNRGFQPLSDLSYDTNHIYAHLENIDLENEDLDALVFDISRGVERYSLNKSSIVAMSISQIIQRVKPQSVFVGQFE